MKCIQWILCVASGSVVIAQALASGPTDAGVAPVWPIIHVAGQGVCADNYGVGLRDGFLSMDERALFTSATSESEKEKWFRPLCYRLGFQKGESLVAESGGSSLGCRQDWDTGFQSGMTAQPVAGSPCLSAGRESGVAFLRHLGRIGEVQRVGQGCVDAYRAGYGQGVSSHSSQADQSVPTPLDLRACYDAGFWDGSVISP